MSINTRRNGDNYYSRQSKSDIRSDTAKQRIKSENTLHQSHKKKK